jgi:hypothetical protein
MMQGPLLAGRGIIGIPSRLEALSMPCGIRAMRIRNRESLYHVTAKQNVPDILAQRILANDKGLIFTVTDPRRLWGRRGVLDLARDAAEKKGSPEQGQQGQIQGEIG